MAIAIKVVHLSKAYQLGEIGTGTISRDLERWFAKVRGKEDPFLKIGETNDRTSKGESDIVWSLKDINFDIEQGDAVGIIGKNGAGKSTLLKLLSRVTSPTTGSIKVKGRIASLLEVGTGFHPELTGKENIFLNGAILGMRKKEITKKFDKIVDFAGVERYVDTPVKRYSSGMYVRLAFAVAAHLESEILIVDEVLAVGDAEFQKKCLGKMGEVSKEEGRTILFVSHNMSAINTLCNKGILLKNGYIQKVGEAHDIIHLYHNGEDSKTNEWSMPTGDENLQLTRASIWPIRGDFYTTEDLIITISFKILQEVKNLVVGFNLYSQYDECLAYCIADDYNKQPIDTYFPGNYTKKFIIPANTLAKGDYTIKLDLGIHNIKRIIGESVRLDFSLISNSSEGLRYIVPDVKGFTSTFRPNWEVLYESKVN